MGLILPEHYDPRLSVRETQEAIKYIRDTFQKEFGKEMNLERISAPLFVEKSSGLNDDLNGVERPVQFDIAGVPGETIEVVHSLAKWKRMALYKYGFQPGEGLYTNMNAIRRAFSSTRIPMLEISSAQFSVSNQNRMSPFNCQSS